MAQPVGRPTVMTEEVLAKLEEAYLNDATDTEACAVAGIGQATLYNYLKANPEFVERRAALKGMTNYRAKVNIISNINKGDSNESKWWLERKGKDDGFSQRQELTGKEGEAIVSIDDSLLQKVITVYGNNTTRKDSSTEEDI